MENIIMEKSFKYMVYVHIKADKPDVEFIGTVNANSLKELKENVRKHARNWNKHLFGRLHVQDFENEIAFFVNP